MIRIKPPIKIPLPLRANEYLASKVHVRSIDFSVRDRYAAHLKPVMLAQANRLVGVLGYAGANQCVVKLRHAFWNAVIDKSLGAVAQARKRDVALRERFR